MKLAKMSMVAALLLGANAYAIDNVKVNGDAKLYYATDDSEKTEKQNDGLTLLKGDFIYFADAAVLQTHREVYGVVIDEKMHELDKQVQQYKIETTDMIPVEIRGKIIPKDENEEGWPYRVEIKEIINVSKPNPQDNEVIKVGKE